MITLKQYNYDTFLQTATKEKWQIIGTQRRAGVCLPLFSIYSQESLGIGEIPDLKLLVDWCQQTGLSIIQLLPLNDSGFNFTPYDAQSSFALDPMYLSLNHLVDATLTDEIRNEINQVKAKPEFNGSHVNYEIKNTKLDLLWKIFQNSNQNSQNFNQFIETNAFWVHNYALYKTIKDSQEQRSWTDWSADATQNQDPQRIRFYSWIQWQLFEQFKVVKQYAQTKNVLLFGDLPLFVSYDSADTWAYQSCFKLDKLSGAPPDYYSEKGQRWGMPIYNWEELEKRGYDYYINKLKYAENFYDLFRIDHAIGLFRVWTIANSEPIENAGLNGVFDPEDEEIWEEHGRKLYQVILENTKMLPCAEDLGAVPDCSPIVLKDLAIPGLDVQRWLKKRIEVVTEEGEIESQEDFLPAEEYRENSIAVISTHDTSHFALWWLTEMSLAEKKLFAQYCGLDIAEDATDISVAQVIKAALAKASATASIFSVQLIHDWLTLAGFEILETKEARINLPGTVSKDNWSIKIPLSLEELIDLPINSVIKEINIAGERCESLYPKCNDFVDYNN